MFKILKLYLTRSEKARYQYMRGRSIAAMGRTGSPRLWLSQHERDAFLQGYGDQRYDRGWQECEREHGKEKGIVSNGKLPNGYYWVRPLVTEGIYRWQLGRLFNGQIVFIGDPWMWDVKDDGSINAAAFTDTRDANTFLHNQFIQVLIAPPEG